MSDNPARVRMRIDLPAETWLEAFCFIPRREVANVVCYVCLYFSRIAHKLLHEQGKIMLGDLCFKEGENGQAELYVRRNHRTKAIVPFPELAMPKNIVGFELIEIRFINGQVMAMLHKIRALFATVKCLWVDSVKTEGSAQTVRMLREICPLLGTVNFLDIAFSSGIAELNRISPSLVAGATYINISISSTIHVPTICDWLTESNGEDGNHKLLCLYSDVESNILALMEQLKQKFMASTRPAPFFVGIVVFGSNGLPTGNFKLYNPATDENLYIGEGPDFLRYAIVRHPRREVPDEGKLAEWLDQRWKQLCETHESYTENQRVVVRVEKKEECIFGMLFGDDA